MRKYNISVQEIFKSLCDARRSIEKKFYVIFRKIICKKKKTETVREKMEVKRKIKCLYFVPNYALRE